MKPRITIGGNLARPAENGVNKNGKDYSRFSVIVTGRHQESDFIINCFLPYHLDEEKLELFQKRIFVMVKGRYSHTIRQGAESYFFNRTLNVTDFATSEVKNYFFEGMQIDFVGTISSYPVSGNKKTHFSVLDNSLSADPVSPGRHIVCQIPYELSPVQLKDFQKGAHIYMQGRYCDRMLITGGGALIERFIDVRDFEILEQPKVNITIGDMFKK